MPTAVRSPASVAVLALLAAPLLGAADTIAPPRLAGELLGGTSGIEPGVAAEFLLPVQPVICLRPEFFVWDGYRPGVGIAGLWHVPFALPPGHDFAIGPRVAFHDGAQHDDPHAEVDALGIYTFPIIPSQPGHHHIEIITALGVLDKDGATIGASVGAGYAYSF
jgi:hypothetical protein